MTKTVVPELAILRKRSTTLAMDVESSSFCRWTRIKESITTRIGVSGAGEPPPCALSDTDVNLSAHPAPIIQPSVLCLTANGGITRAAFWHFSTVGSNVDSFVSSPFLPYCLRQEKS